MAREAEGFQLRYHRGAWQLRCTIGATRYERSTGISDPKARPAATRRGREIFGSLLRGDSALARPPAPRPVTDEGALDQCLPHWESQLSDIRAATRATYRKYGPRWVKEFPLVTDITEQTLAIYVRRRLGEVRAKSVRSELGALRRFVAWLKETGRIKREPTIPRVKAGVTGTPFKHRRRVRAPELSPEEVDRFLAALPVTSERGYWIRDRLVVAFETTLRTATVERLRAPDNYAVGAETLILTDSDDKESYGRELPLSQKARDALDRCCPKEGIIFGPRTGLFKYVRQAAARVLPAHKAAVLCAQHMRSAGITRLLELTANLPGVQELAGHKRAATTSLYSRRSTRAARAVIEAADRMAGTSRGESSAAEKK